MIQSTPPAHYWVKIALTVIVLLALVGLALLSTRIPSLQTLYIQISGSLLGLLGLHHGHDLVSQSIGGSAGTSSSSAAPSAAPSPLRIPVPRIELAPPAPEPAPVKEPSQLTPEQILQGVMTAAHPDVVREHAAAMAAATAKWNISAKPERLAMFLANCALECNQLRNLEEEWGPSEAQLRYEPPSHTAHILGNTEPGDGKRFMGRGVIQITGRDNYRRAGEAIGRDLIATPYLALDPSIAWDVAGWFWSTHGLNRRADNGDFQGTVLAINGGLTDLKERCLFYSRACKLLGLQP